MKNFGAVLLAGGRSTRMRANKALLDYNGIPIWRFQMNKLVELGPDELYFSVQPATVFPQGPWEFVHDRSPHLGPLAGLEAALRQTHADFLVALAVDMPGITVGFLSELLERSGPAGTVPRVDGFYCGTAAVYPVGILPLVRMILTSNDRSFQHLICQALESGLMNAKEIPPARQSLFSNWNSRKDLRKANRSLPESARRSR